MHLKQKEQALIDFLNSKKKPTSLVSLARTIDVSTRTVRNYISNINKAYDATIISITKNGVVLDREYTIANSKQAEDTSPMGKRSNIILKRLLIDHDDHLDLFDLADDLNISYSTLKSDLVKINKAYSRFSINLASHDDLLSIEGSERDKRRLLSDIIFEESNSNLFDLSIIEQNFLSYNIKEIISIIRDAFKSEGMDINDFALLNLALHTVIIIDRIYNDKLIEMNESPIADKSVITKKIVSKLEFIYDMRFSNNEIIELRNLVEINRSLRYNNINVHKETSIQSELGAVVRDIINNINMIFAVNLNHPMFFDLFITHIHSMISRIIDHRELKNPMLSVIKEKSPIIFEIATHFSSQLADYYSLAINEDEIAFLALHIGAEIERTTTELNKIKCLLITPNYHDIAKTLSKSLLDEFGDVLSLSVSDISSSLNYDDFDLILSTIPQNITTTKVITISPFDISESFPDIERTVKKIISIENKQNFVDTFDRIFSETLFDISDVASNKDYELKRMINRLVDSGYVTDSFYEEVMEREAYSSTVFSYCAVPHSFKMKAIETSISIAINTAGVSWGDKTVHFIILVSINELDVKMFRELYENILNIFNDTDTLQLLRNIKSFKEFALIIKQ